MTRPTSSESWHSGLILSALKTSFRSSAMEDQEGYTALQLKGRKPEDEEGYTALQFIGRRKPEDRREDVLRADSQVPRFQRSALWIFVALALLLVLALVGCGVWVFRLHQKNGVLMATLKQRGEWNASVSCAGAHPAPSCPLHWQQHGRKCYYFPEIRDEKNWSASHEDCSSRGSRLVVIEDKAELDYLTSKLTNYVWIGLFCTPAGRRWTWVNGSTLNENVLPVTTVTGYAGADWRGSFRRGSIESNPCANGLHWICQKEARVSCSAL
ncbi:killer cell lectin-like receptor subfamily B member 1A [Lissotriton helveticus]